MIDTAAGALSHPVLIQKTITGPLQLGGHNCGCTHRRAVKEGVLALEGGDQKGAARSNLGGQESGEDAGVRFSWVVPRVVQVGERPFGEVGGGPPRVCVLCLAEMSRRVSVADGFCWFQWVSLAFGREHVLGSPVQLQGRDGADVSGQFGFPPHQRALSTLLLLDLNEGREVQKNGSKTRTPVSRPSHDLLTSVASSCTVFFSVLTSSSGGPSVSMSTGLSGPAESWYIRNCAERKR